MNALRGIPFFALACFAAILAVAPAFASGLSQTESLAAAAAVAKRGSDEKLQQSTTSAMRAVMDLSEANRPGAVRNGYKAFGEYRTSQDLDMDRMRGRIRQIDLFTSTLSATSAVPDWARKRESFSTSYSRLDPKFLRQGEAGKVAAEFERRSGMPREQFLKWMAKASDTPLSGDAPGLESRVLGRFHNFVNEIPNEAFRESVRKQLDDTSMQAKAGLIRDGVERLGEMLAKHGIQFTGTVAMAEPAEGSRAPASALAGDAPVARDHAGAAGAFTGVVREDPLNASRGSFVRDIAPRDADFRGLAHEKFSDDAIGSVMQSAIAEQEMTIFRQVSRRYRAVTPMLNRL